MSVPRQKDILDIARDMLREATGGCGGGGDSPRRVHGNLISQQEVRAAKAEGRRVLVVTPGTIVTPLARDAAGECGIELRYEDETKGAPIPTAKNEPAGGPAPAQGGRIAVGSDHGGFELKEAIKNHLEARGLPVDDHGTHSRKSCDYPDLAASVAKAVSMGEADWGILVDGAGIGSCMAAGKVPGVLAATCHDVRTAKNCREHNGANVLCLGSGTLQGRAAIEVVDAWLDMPFAGGRHGRRVDKIRAIERGFTR